MKMLTDMLDECRAENERLEQRAIKAEADVARLTRENAQQPKQAGSIQAGFLLPDKEIKQALAASVETMHSIKMAAETVRGLAQTVNQILIAVRNA